MTLDARRDPVVSDDEVPGQDVQGNYAAIFSLWDRLFRTSLPQRGDAPLDVGMDDEPTLPADWAGQMAWPFRSRIKAP